MFWKKKDKRDQFDVEFNEDVRSTFRVTPAKDEPIFVYVGKGSCLVDNLSAGGMAFDRPVDTEKGDVISISFRLPYINHEIQAQFKITRIDDSKICGAFENLETVHEEAIHQYALALQKAQALKRKQKTVISQS